MLSKTLFHFEANETERRVRNCGGEGCYCMFSKAKSVSEGAVRCVPLDFGSWDLDLGFWERRKPSCSCKVRIPAGLRGGEEGDFQFH